MPTHPHAPFLPLPPQDQRLTPAKALQQWRAYSARVAAAQQRHNAAVLALRERKRGLIARITAINQRLAVLNTQLGLTGGWLPGGEEQVGEGFRRLVAGTQQPGLAVCDTGLLQVVAAAGVL